MLNANTIFFRIMDIGAVQRQSLISFFGQITITLFGFLSTMYFAHAVGAGVLGAYFLILAYYSIINTVTDGGFGGAAIKRISEGKEKDAYFSAFFILRTLSVVMAVLALIAFRSYFVDLETAGTFRWLLLALMVSILSGAVLSGLAGCCKMGIYSTCELINNVLRLVVQVIAVFLGFGIGGLIGGFIAGTLVSAVLVLRFFDLHIVRFKWRHIKSLSTFSFWLFLTSSGMMIYTYADQVMIGYYLNNADVGLYGIVLRLAAIATFTTTALRSTLWPKVSLWGKTGEIKLVEESLSRALSYSLILAVPVLAGGVLLGDKLLYFFYGSEFGVGYSTLVIMLLVQVVNVFQYFFTMYLDALNRPKDSFKVTAVAMAANIGLNLLLIPVIGIKGAALATLLTMILNAILARRILSEIIKINLERESVLNILKASVVMSLFLGAYRLIVPLTSVWLVVYPVVLGAIIYGILILKLDIKIHDELKGIVTQMNIQWPHWL